MAIENQKKVDVKMEEKKKVLIVMGGSSMGVGGIESMVINYYRGIDKEKVQIDFVFYGEGQGLYDQELIANGSKIYHLPIKSKHYIKSQRALKELLLREKYDVVHANLNAAGILAAMKMAKKCGIKVRVSHAHSASHGVQNKIRWYLNDHARKQIKKYSTHNFACSDKAGQWYYGEKPFELVKNAIPVEEYLYNEEIRGKVRNSLEADGKFVVGHVGNLGFPKNQAFLIQAFAEVKKMKENAVLWLIGEGEDLENLQNQVQQLGIEDSVKFLGKRFDVNELLQGMDVFALPSFFEGFPVVIVEAVASDLPCVVSDSITKMTQISDKVTLLSLQQDVKEWAEQIVKFDNEERRNNYELITEKAFNIKEEAKKLEHFYCNGRYE